MGGKLMFWIAAMVAGVAVEVYFANQPKVFGEDIGGYAPIGPYGPLLYIIITYTTVWVLGGVLFYKDMIDDIDVDRKDPYLDNP